MREIEINGNIISLIKIIHKNQKLINNRSRILYIYPTNDKISYVY
jgi:hypothetical protein